MYAKVWLLKRQPPGCQEGAAIQNDSPARAAEGPPRPDAHPLRLSGLTAPPDVCTTACVPCSVYTGSPLYNSLTPAPRHPQV